MNLSLPKALTIARHEYLVTVRRPAFLLTLLLTPAIFLLSGVFSTRMQMDDARTQFSRARVVALVDSSGLFAEGPASFEYRLPGGAAAVPGGSPSTPAVLPVVMRPYADQAVALDSLEAGHVRQVLVVAEDFLATGRTRLYEHDTRVFTSSSDDRPLRHWLTRELLRGQADSARIERTLTLGRSMDLYTQTRDGAWAIKDDARELTGFLLPFAVSFLLAMAILMGSQYLLQGVSEEKESRILESMLCSVTPDELMLGKLLGLGGVGLTLVGAWATAGLWSSAGVLAMANVTLPASLLLIALAYFVVGYLLYGAVMLTLGALAPNLREATQISSYLILFNVSPFWVATSFMNAPNGPLAVGLSLFPPTAATSMLMRLGTATVSGATIPAWEIALSLTLLTLSALLAVLAGARLFRLGMLLHGKTPNLPTILRLLKTR